MVNNQNPYLLNNPALPAPPDIDDASNSDRKISDSPLWNLSEIVDIASHHSDENVTIRMVTRDADRDYENLLENGFDLLEQLKKLKTNGHFKGSWWCKASPATDRLGRPRGKGSWIPCDAYTITEKFENPHNGCCGTVKYYLKMSKNLDGTAILFVSLHV